MSRSKKISEQDIDAFYDQGWNKDWIDRRIDGIMFIGEAIINIERKIPRSIGGFLGIAAAVSPIIFAAYYVSVERLKLFPPVNKIIVIVFMLLFCAPPVTIFLALVLITFWILGPESAFRHYKRLIYLGETRWRARSASASVAVVKLALIVALIGLVFYATE